MSERLAHVLLIYRDMIPSIRLCGHGQMQWLAQQNRIEYRAKQAIHLSNHDIDWADIVLLGRLDSWFEHQIVCSLHRAGKYLVYVLDDDLLNIPEGWSVSAYYRNASVKSRIRGMLDMSHAVLSTSPLILKKYAGDGMKKAIETDGYQVKKAFSKVRLGSEKVKIGFAGSFDRSGDIEKILMPVMIRLKEFYQDRIEFEFFGVQPCFAEKIGAKLIPYVDNYEDYRCTLLKLNWDIGLAPMPDTEFHACKYINKFIEYASVGIVGVFSRVLPYTRLENVPSIAVLCSNNEEEWYQTLRMLIENPETRIRIREEAYQYVTQRHSLDIVASRLEADMREIFDYRAPKRRERIPILRLKFVGICFRVLDVFRRYGWKVIPRTIWKIKSRIRGE